jgi:hypothetical protein
LGFDAGAAEISISDFTDAQLTYNFSNATLALTSPFGELRRVGFRFASSDASARQYVFALEVPADELSNLPVVGDKLPANIGINDCNL